MHGKAHMLIVCHLSYQDSEAMVHMKQNANPHRTTIISIVTMLLRHSLLIIEMPNCCNSLIGALCQLSYPSPKLKSCVNFRWQSVTSWTLFLTCFLNQVATLKLTAYNRHKELKHRIYNYFQNTTLTNAKKHLFYQQSTKLPRWMSCS